MENKFKLEIHLKQHTPIIHFQHAQPGATLRATEVKPKLDRFIRENFKRLFISAEDHFLYSKLDLFEPSEKKQSSYKLSINREGTEKPNEYYLASYLKGELQNRLAQHDKDYLHGTAFFAQENESSKVFPKVDLTNGIDGFNLEAYQSLPKLGLLETGKIKLTIFSFDKDILSIISKSIPYFFAYENFGTRQNKGFGCFSVVDPKPLESMDTMIKKLFPVFAAKVELTNLSSDAMQRLQKIMETIQSDYKLLKSGKNPKENRGKYSKSLLFSYAVTRNIPVRWEKRKIKQQINAGKFELENSPVPLQYTNQDIGPVEDDANKRNWDDPAKGYKYQFIRAMLGLAEQYEFLTSRRDSNGREAKYVVKVEAHSPAIQRFKSPVLFKIHNNTIYLIAEDVNSAMLNQGFNFGLELKIGKNISKANGHKMPLDSINTPESFNMKEFLTYALQKGKGELSDYKPL
ncbi:MAG: hypothetical protein SFV55_20745 [Haliscomenobacter sp.]|uniref:hypothetical protein n=1 Tax=Haliscomenobacter sp. TaxID=2717303 RepID=UPI0029BA7AE6|nr:hypothetical protein [Haliscomenobacter sp.]MDX2070870.1 hypothetical protein [Haliscomenobacter sp.]